MWRQLSPVAATLVIGLLRGVSDNPIWLASYALIPALVLLSPPRRIAALAAFAYYLAASWSLRGSAKVFLGEGSQFGPASVAGAG